MSSDGSVTANDSPLRARTHPGCFACGENNPRGLRLRFRNQETGYVEAAWVPSGELEGFRGIVHGGIVSTALDEAMSKAVASSKCEALTAELRVRFRKPVETERELFVRGWIHHRNKRHIETEATLTDAGGNEYAHAWAVFLALSNGRGRSQIACPEEAAPSSPTGG